MLGAYAKASEPAKATQVLWRMLGANLQPDTVTLNSLLLAHANASDAAGAMEVEMHGFTCSISARSNVRRDIMMPAGTFLSQVMAVFERLAQDECPKAVPDTVS